jgi:hypothetical protein
VSSPIFHILPDDLRTMLRAILKVGRGVDVHPLQLMRHLQWDAKRVDASVELLDELGFINRLPNTLVPTLRGRAQLKDDFAAEDSSPWTQGQSPERRRWPRTKG